MSNSRSSYKFRTVTRMSERKTLPTGGRKWDNPWWKKAACFGLDTDMFFDDGVWEGGDFPTTAARICHDCPVYVTCRLAGYGEYHGVWGNQRPHVRKTTRTRIFGRLFPREIAADDGLLSLRRVINALIEEATDVLATMRRRGFSEEEIGLLLAESTLDERARAVAEKQGTFTTRDKMHQNMKNGVLYAH